MLIAITKIAKLLRRYGVWSCRVVCASGTSEFATRTTMTRFLWWNLSMEIITFFCVLLLGCAPFLSRAQPHTWLYHNFCDAVEKKNCGASQKAVRIKEKCKLWIRKRQIHGPDQWQLTMATIEMGQRRDVEYVARHYIHGNLHSSRRRRRCRPSKPSNVRCKFRRFNAISKWVLSPQSCAKLQNVQRGNIVAFRNEQKRRCVDK